MVQNQPIVVRRARPSDAGRIAEFVNRAWGESRVDEMDVIERMGNVGFLLAEREGTLVGMLGWRVENLVVRLTDFVVSATSQRMNIGQALLEEMEQTADELQCEAALLFLPRAAPKALIDFYQALGYESKPVTELPKAWQEAAYEGGRREGETILLKQLREDRIMRPI